MSSDLTSASIPITAQTDAVLAQQNIRALNANDVQGAPAQDSKKFDKTLQDYEGVFLSQMVSHMSEGVGVDPLFGGGVGEQTMKSLLTNEYGKLMAARGGIGLAAAMKKQLLAAQEQGAVPMRALPGHSAPADTTPAVDAANGAPQAASGETQP